MTPPRTAPDSTDRGESVPYWPFYCEENIWHLCNVPEVVRKSPQVLFISNESRSVALWSQRRAPAPGLPVFWDYHVILLCRSQDQWEVWDLDSSLPLPCPATLYLTQTFPVPAVPPFSTEPRFRRLSADQYRATLATDRRHMQDAAGAYLQTPPPWSPIGEGSNLMRFVSMADDFHGEVLDLPALEQSLLET